MLRNAGERAQDVRIENTDKRVNGRIWNERAGFKTGKARKKFFETLREMKLFIASFGTISEQLQNFREMEFKIAKMLS